MIVALNDTLTPPTEAELAQAEALLAKHEQSANGLRTAYEKMKQGNRARAVLTLQVYDLADGKIAGKKRDLDTFFERIFFEHHRGKPIKSPETGEMVQRDISPPHNTPQEILGEIEAESRIPNSSKLSAEEKALEQAILGRHANDAALQTAYLQYKKEGHTNPLLTLQVYDLADGILGGEKYSFAEFHKRIHLPYKAENTPHEKKDSTTTPSLRDTDEFSPKQLLNVLEREARQEQQSAAGLERILLAKHEQSANGLRTAYEEIKNESPARAVLTLQVYDLAGGILAGKKCGFEEFHKRLHFPHKGKEILQKRKNRFNIFETPSITPLRDTEGKAPEKLLEALILEAYNNKDMEKAYRVKFEWQDATASEKAWTALQVYNLADGKLDGKSCNFDQFFDRTRFHYDGYRQVTASTGKPKERALDDKTPAQLLEAIETELRQPRLEAEKRAAETTAEKTIQEVLEPHELNANDRRMFSVPFSLNSETRQLSACRRHLDALEQQLEKRFGDLRVESHTAPMLRQDLFNATVKHFTNAITQWAENGNDRNSLPTLRASEQAVEKQFSAQIAEATLIQKAQQIISRDFKSSNKHTSLIMAPKQMLAEYHEIRRLEGSTTALEVLQTFVKHQGADAHYNRGPAGYIGLRELLLKMKAERTPNPKKEPVPSPYTMPENAQFETIDRIDFSQGIAGIRQRYTNTSGDLRSSMRNFLVTLQETRQAAASHGVPTDDLESYALVILQNNLQHCKASSLKAADAFSQTADELRSYMQQVNAGFHHSLQSFCEENYGAITGNNITGHQATTDTHTTKAAPKHNATIRYYINIPTARRSAATKVVNEANEEPDTTAKTEVSPTPEKTKPSTLTTAGKVAGVTLGTVIAGGFTAKLLEEREQAYERASQDGKTDIPAKSKLLTFAKVAMVALGVAIGGSFAASLMGKDPIAIAKKGGASVTSHVANLKAKLPSPTSVTRT